MPTEEKEVTQKDIEISKNAMKRILDLCIEFKIKRMVYTSSVVAIEGGNENSKGYRDETDWAEIAPNEEGYGASKTIVEKYAWEYMDELRNKNNTNNNEMFEFVCINPSMVVGPCLNKYIMPDSFQPVKVILDKTYPFYARIRFNYVDVRDGMYVSKCFFVFIFIFCLSFVCFFAYILLHASLHTHKHYKHYKHSCISTYKWYVYERSCRA